MVGPVIPFCDSIGAVKYRMPGENYRESSNRIAGALADNPAHFHRFRDLLLDMKTLPAGRIQTWAGCPKIVTPYNCFVSPTIHDSFVDGPRQGDGSDPLSVSIMKAAEYAAQTMRQGGGLGFAFSTLRPGGDIIAGVQSVSDGPLAFMPIFNAVCTATSSAGNRRGAMMGMLRCDHPDIERFILVKQNTNVLNGFNLSIAVTDELMHAVALDRLFALRFNGKTYRYVDARALWEMIMRSTWDWAEPGVIFIDTINRMNNLWYCEQIAATNPCAEQPLPPYGACLLGSINLVKYVTKQPGGKFSFDDEALAEDIEPFIRAMDNVIDKAIYPLPQQATEAKDKRRMGIGVMGLANAIEALGHSYGSPDFVELSDWILQIVTNECYRASIRLAEEKGPFPLFSAKEYLQGQFIKTLPDDIRDGIKRYGIRNSHLTSIAPTGTISLYADNVSGGIEPVFALSQERTVLMPNGAVKTDVLDYGFREFGISGKTTAQVTIDEHLAVLLTAAQNVDSSVSKTINHTGVTPWESFKSVYMRAWEGGAKGCATFNKDGKRMGILQDKDSETAQACFIDPSTGQKSCS